MARPPKKPTSTTNDDPAVGVQELSLEDPENERRSSGPEEKEDDEDVDDDDVRDGETFEPMLGIQRVPHKTKIPARSTAAEDRATCVAWYVTFLNLKQDAAEYLYDQEDLTKPTNWAK